MNRLDLGAVSAYAMAKEKGYTGTEEEFAALMAESGNNALRAEEAAALAQTVKDSIPEDYTALSASVDTLTEENVDVKRDLSALFYIENPVFEVGGITTMGIVNPDSTGRAHTDYIYVNGDIEITVTNLLYDTVGAAYYDTGKNYITQGTLEYTSQKEYVSKTFEIKAFEGSVRLYSVLPGDNVFTDERIAEIQQNFILKRGDYERVAGNIMEELNEFEETLNRTAAFEVDTNKPYNLMPHDNYVLGHQIDANTGEVVESSANLVASDFFEVDASKRYVNVGHYWYDGDNSASVPIHSTRHLYAFYNADKKFITDIVNSSVNDWVKEIPQNAKYMRITMPTERSMRYGRIVYADSKETDASAIAPIDYKLTPTNLTVKGNTGYEKFTMVCFGDSVTHGNLLDTSDGRSFSFVDYAGQELNANIINVGFGGTRMAKFQDEVSETGLFTFYKLCECIVSDDPDVWEPLDAYANSGNVSYRNHLEVLKNIDWNTVNAISILYGANDFTTYTPVGTEYNTDIAKFDGACAYGLDLLLTKYPHLQVLLISPFYREIDYPDDGTDIKPNAAGMYMRDYGQSLKNVQSIVHCPISDWEAEIGISKYTIGVYTNDGTHPRRMLGHERLGHRLAEDIKRYLYHT